MRRHLKSQKTLNRKEDTNLSQPSKSSSTRPRNNLTRSGSPQPNTRKGVRRSSCIHGGQQKAGYAVITDDEVSELGLCHKTSPRN